VTTQQRRPERRLETAAVSWAADNLSVKPLAASALVRAEIGRILALVDAAQLGRRVAQDSLSEATACTWWRRAEMLEWARPRPGDFNGRATPEEMARRDRKLAEQAEACRHAAELYQRRLLEFEALS